MAQATTTGTSISRRAATSFYSERVQPIVSYGRRNPSLLVGLGMLFGLLLFVGINTLTYPNIGDGISGGAPVRDKSHPPSWCRWGSLEPSEQDLQARRSRLGSSLRGLGSLFTCDKWAEYEERYGELPGFWRYPMGTDTQSRDLFAVNLQGVPLTLGTGLIAGLLSVGVGTTMAFAAAYYRGLPDGVIRLMTDVGISIPGLLVLIIIRIQLGSELNWWQIGMALALVGWVFTARTVRSQVLVLREQPYVEIARQSGASGLTIIFREMMPNLIPYITASFVASVAGSILATIGLEALGLGDFDANSLGMTIYWVIQFGAITLGMWWWWLFPLVAIVVIFVSLFMISAGLDEWSNPRLRKQV